MSYHYIGQADWFYGINKPPPEAKCPEGMIKEVSPGGFRCMPPPQAPVTAMDPALQQPATGQETAPVTALPIEEDDILDFVRDNKLVVAGGAAFVLALIILPILLR